MHKRKRRLSQVDGSEANRSSIELSEPALPCRALPCPSSLSTGCLTSLALIEQEG